MAEHVQLSQEVLKEFPPRDHFNDNLTESYNERHYSKTWK